MNNRLFFDIERALDEDHILHVDVKTSRCTQVYVSNHFWDMLFLYKMNDLLRPLFVYSV